MTDSSRDLGVSGDRIRSVTTAGVAGLAIGAFLLSYDALHQLARASHVPSPLAWLWPFIVDGFILVASLAVLDNVHAGRRTRYPWLLVLAFSALSVTFNVLHAPRDPVAQLVAAIPPLALVLSFELLMRQIRHRLQPAPARAVAPHRDHAADAGRPAAGPPSTPVPSPTTATGQTPPRPKRTVPAAAKATRQPRAVTQARAAAVRDECLRTGQPVTTTILAGHLGVSDGYARRLLRDLNESTSHDHGVADRPVMALRAVSDE